MRRPAWALLALACALPSVVLASLEATQAKVTFTCGGPAGFRMQGRGHELQATDKGEVLVVTVPVAKVTTGNSLRDTHMQERYLESDKYPTAELVVQRADSTFPGDGANVDATAAGNLTIHGVSRVVTVHYRAWRKGNIYEVQGDLHINVNDYDIPTPSFLGVTVRPSVDIDAFFQLLET